MSTELLPIEQTTDLISYALRVNDTDLPEMPVASIVVYREVNRIPTARIIIYDGDATTGSWDQSSSEIFVPGNQIEILVGYHGENDSIFKGIVTRQLTRLRNKKLELEIECKEDAYKMTLARKSQQFEEETDSDIAADILGSYGLAGDITTTMVTHNKMIQYHCSDWDFLVCRMEANGLVCSVHDGVVDCIKPELASNPLATARLGTNLYEFETEIDARKQPLSVSSLVWDPSIQDVSQVDAADPGWITPGNFSPDDLASNAGSEEILLRHSAHLSADEQQNWADACLLRRRLTFLRGRVKLQGFSKAALGMTLALEGLGDRFNGNVWVSGFIHEIIKGDWFVTLQIGLSDVLQVENFPVQALGAGSLLPAIEGLHPGIVTQLAGDPDSEYQIRVKIPSIIADDDGIWARVATFDAGKCDDNSPRGTYCLPEINDEVIVGFLENDIRFPVVLGMLPSSFNPSPSEPDDKNNKKGYVSRSGIQLTFDDQQKSVTLKMPSGSQFFLDDTAGEIHIEDANSNKVVMSKDGISFQAQQNISIKSSAGDVSLEGTNVSLKSNASMSITGTAQAELKSSGITKVTGTMVQIN